MSARKAILIAILIAAAIASWILSRQDRESAEVVATTETGEPGYYLRSARILGTGRDGELLYEIQAASAQQMGDDLIEFTDVRVNYTPASEVPWSVVADSATLHPDSDQIRLMGHVRAISSEGFSGNDTEIRTEVLLINPVTYTAETDERVQIRIGPRSLTATGMVASLNDNRLRLESNVSGKFVP